MGWIDGKCKECGKDIEETGTFGTLSFKYIPTKKEKQIIKKMDYDYINICTNKNCKNHVLHFIFDDEFLDYYEHRK